MTLQSISWSEITFKSLKRGEIIGETHAAFQWRQPLLLAQIINSWFSNKSAVAIILWVSIVNQKNAVGKKILPLYFSF